jgi:hypothetical protein
LFGLPSVITAALTFVTMLLDKMVAAAERQANDRLNIFAFFI